MPDEARYAFGKNWRDFVARHLTDERVDIATRSLLGFLRRDALPGLHFLDVGCGSGIHSLAAVRAGAARVTSFDYDPDSVATTHAVREHAGAPEHWHVLQGDVLDRAFLSGLGTADVVYSWGVLHHTGDMWTALANTSRLMAPDGVLFVALYTADVYDDPEYWLRTKQAYNRGSWLTRRALELRYVWQTTLRPNLRSPLVAAKTILGYKRSRGMAYLTDVRDWLGGWPMEFAAVAEVRRRVRALDLELLHADGGGANTEYLLRRRGASTYWDEVRAAWQVHELSGPYTHRGGLAWSAPLPELADRAGADDDPRRSTLLLLEDGVPLGPRYALPGQVERFGAGAFRHWREDVVFSTLDGSDPNLNGRRYTYCST